MTSRRMFHGAIVGLAAASAWPQRSVAQDASVTAIDSHAHVFKRGLPLAANIRYAPDYDATPEDYIRNLDAKGMSNGFLVQPSFLGTDNSYMLEALRRYPNRFRGIVVVQPDIRQDALQELAAAGVVGIRLNLIGVQNPQFNADPGRCC
ncbi:MAG: amidohydrolase family protein [Microvirga sp.]